MVTWEQRAEVQTFANKSVREVIEDTNWLRSRHQDVNRERIRNLCDGGPEGVARAMGFDVSSGDIPPVSNRIYSGMQRFAQKLLDVPVPKSFTRSIDESIVKQHELIEEIVEGYDEISQWDMAQPQAARWLPGYGFAVAQIVDWSDANGNPYPQVQLRDPFDCFPAPWGHVQQPDRIAYCYRVDPKRLARQFPEHAQQILRGQHQNPTSSGYERGWTGDRLGTIEVFEYVDESGTWLVIPQPDTLLSFTPNPIYPLLPFSVAKRFSFNKLIGHFDHALGLMIAQSRLNALTVAAVEEQVEAPIFVNGQLQQDVINFGRHEWNEVDGTVTRLPSTIDARVFQQRATIDDDLRTNIGYSIIDDSKSPNSFVTGRGLQTLLSGVDNETKEYRLVMRKWREDLDFKSLAWDEQAYGRRRKPIFPDQDGARRARMYRPTDAISGRWRIHRQHQLMDGWEDSESLVAGLQLAQGRFIPRRQFVASLDGIDDVEKALAEIDAERAEELLDTVLEQLAGQGDQRALQVFAGRMRESDKKRVVEELFGFGEQAQGAEQQAAGPPGAQPGLPQAPEDSQTILSRLFAGGGSEAGVQLVQGVG